MCSFKKHSTALPTYKRLGLIIAFVFLIQGCATNLWHPTYEGIYTALKNRERGEVRVFKSSYGDVYNAVKKVLYKLGYVIYSEDYGKGEIFSRHPPFASIGYAYLFVIEKANDGTRVILKASGGLSITSDKDMLNTYLAKELGEF